MNRILAFFPVIIILSILALTPGCRKEDQDTINEVSARADSYDSQVPFVWGELFLEIDRYSPGYRPPAAARMLAYTGLAVYEAALPGMPEYRSLEYQFSGLDIPSSDPNAEYHWPTAVNAAFATCYRNFYPHVSNFYKGRIDNTEKAILEGFRGQVDPNVLDRSAAFGRNVAEAVFQYSTTDPVGHEAFLNPHPTDYNPPADGPNGEKYWQPSWPDYTRALFPYWGNVRPFALKPSDKIGRPPLAWSEDPNSMFYNQAREVQLWVNNATYEDRWIAEFWSDDIFELTFEPAGRLLAIGNQVMQEDQVSLAKGVELYAKLGMALCDVGIAVWNSKFLYNVERPISYVRRVLEPDWKTLLNNPIAKQKGVSPPFPAYPSGHSGFGGAGAAILSDVFGNTRGFVDRCHQNRTEFIGTPRAYNNFMEMGVENAYSRMPLGVHYRMDCDEGLRLGYLAARRVIEMPWKK